MSNTLNEKQRKLVEDNHNLIYAFLKKKNLSLNATEDWYGTAAIGLCKAAMTFDETKGSNFSTLAYICMDNEVKQIMRKERKLAKPVVSLDEELESGCACLCDLVADNRDPFFSVYLNEAIEIALRGVSDRDKAILNLVIHTNMTNRAVGDKFGVSQATVSKIYNRFIDKVREYFND